MPWRAMNRAEAVDATGGLIVLALVMLLLQLTFLAVVFLFCALGTVVAARWADDAEEPAASEATDAAPPRAP